MESSNNPCANLRKSKLQPMLELVNELIEGTASMTGSLTFLQEAGQELGDKMEPLSPEILSELQQLFTAANLLLYKQQGLIKHERLMERATEVGHQSFLRAKAFSEKIKSGEAE